MPKLQTKEKVKRTRNIVLDDESVNQNLFDLDDALAGAEEKLTKKKAKSTVPVIKLNKEEQELVLQLRKAIEAYKDAESKLGDFKDQVVPIASEERVRLCTEGKTYLSTVRLPASDGTSVTVTWVSKYKFIAFELGKKLKEIVGEKFDDLFRRNINISVKEDVTEEELKDFITTLGKEKFEKYCKVTQGWIPTEIYTKFFFSFPETVQQDLRMYVEQNKPSVKK
jgi:glutaredoxin